MDVTSSHLVPPLPQRRSTARTHRPFNSSRTVPSIENQLIVSGQQQQQHEFREPSSTDGYFTPTLFNRVTPTTHRRAIHNEYHDISSTNRYFRHPVVTSPTTTSDVTSRPAAVHRDVVVEISARGEPITRTTASPTGADVVSPSPSTWKPSVDGGGVGSSQGHSTTDAYGESIICAECGKCRCAECAKTSTSSLSSLSQSSASQLCCLASSPGDESCCERTIDVVSCACCVQAVMPHRVGEPDPCSCSSGESASKCCRRWTFLVAISMCVPCLCLYVPLRCMLYACTELCVDSRQRACRCRPPLVSLASKDEKGSYVTPAVSVMTR